MTNSSSETLLPVGPEREERGREERGRREREEREREEREGGERKGGSFGQFGVGHLWWFNYPCRLLHTEWEYTVP